MTEQSSTIDNRTELLATPSVDFSQTQTRSDMTSTSSSGVEVYFQCAVVVIGVIGIAANALILYALVASKQHRQHILIFNQNLLDLISCVFLVVTYSAKLTNIRLVGSSGHWICMALLSELGLWCAIIGSKVGLAMITIERYLRVIHSVWSQTNLEDRVLYSAAALSWIIGWTYNVTLSLTTTGVVDGVCYAWAIWESEVAMAIHGAWNFLSFYVIILSVLIFCYGRILLVIRRQARVMSGHGESSSNSALTQLIKTQMNAIKTMVIVSTFFAVTNFPVDVYFLLLNVNANVSLLEGGYYATVFVMLCYSCTNPFIYAMKFDPVKRILLRFIPCKKVSDQPGGTLQGTGFAAAGTRIRVRHTTNV